MSNAIRKYRTAKGLTQKDLAEQVGVLRLNVVHWEKGTYQPTIDNAKKLGQILGFDWKEIYEETKSND